MNRKKILKDILGWILYIAVLAGLIFGLPRGLSYFLKTNYPMASITSGSMWPTLKKGDLVFIKGIQDKGEIKEGEIVVYRNLNGFTIHRVIKINGDTLITKGDANNVFDPAITFDKVVGRILSVNGKIIKIPLLGSISIWANKDKL